MLRGDGGSLFLSPIPEPPGDPAALAAGAAAYTAAEGEIGRDRATLTGAAAGLGGQWTGTGAAGFETTSAAAGFDAAAADLAGNKPRPARGGATGVSGGNPWQTVVDKLAVWNDRAGWGLNAWGAFGTFVLTKAEVGYLEAAAGFGTASAGYDDAIAAVLARSGGFFGPDGFYAAQAAFNAALKTRSGAASELADAIAPKTGSWGLMDVLGRGGLGLGMASDAVTEIAPTPSFGPDGLLGGNTDRVMAGLNFTASGLALGGSLGIDAAAGVVAIIPGGQVVVGGVLIGTAAYFAGEYVYQHWGTIAGLGADAWHGIDSAGSWAGHQLSNIGGDIGKAFSWL